MASIGFVLLTVWISTCNYDVTSITCWKVRAQWQFRIIRVVENQKPRMWSICKQAFDVVKTTIYKERCSNLLKAVLDTIHGTSIDPKYSPVSLESFEVSFLPCFNKFLPTSRDESEHTSDRFESFQILRDRIRQIDAGPTCRVSTLVPAVCEVSLKHHFARCKMD